VIILKKDGMRSTIDNQDTLEILPMEDEMVVSIEVLWANMPASSKQYYGYDVDVYRHHKIIQAMRDSEE
jgi:hypothetical protein